MTYGRRLLAASVIFCAPAALFGGVRLLHAQQETLALPDTQKLLMENQFVRVFEIRVPPRGFEAKHSHGRGLTIALSDYDNETTSFPDGRVNRGHTTFGEVRWAEPVTHEATNVGTTEQRVIRIELK